MPRRKTKGTLGGWRPGAGRPRIVQDRVRFTLDFERAQLEALQALAKESGESVAALVRRIVDGFLARRRGR
jgi:hypothetical protein